jgi:ribosome-associated protein
MNDDEIISKTRRKAAMHDLQALGEALIGLSNERLAKLNLPENLLHAIAEAKRISVSKHGALKRQRQYIGRLMRDVDAAPIREALERWGQTSAAAVTEQHLAERWRERLIRDDNEFTEFASDFPCADLSRLRQLARNARDEQAKEKPPRAFRELYRAVHDLIVNQSAEESGEEDG